MKKKLVLLGAIPALGAAAAFVTLGPLGSSPARSAPPAEAAAATRSVIAQGVVEAQAGVADVRSQATGRVLRVHVREGDAVSAGQLLAELDDAEAAARVAALEADVAGARADLTWVQRGPRKEEKRAAAAELKAARAAAAQAEDDAARAEKLVAGGFAGTQEADSAARAAEAARARRDGAQARKDLAFAGGRAEQVAVARARVAAAEAALVEARQRLGHHKIVAPIDGVVLARHVDAGDTVTAGPGGTGVLFELADDARTELRIEIEDLDALLVSVGTDVKITAPGGRAELGRGKIVRLSPRLGKRTIGADEARVRAETPVRSAWIEWTDVRGASPPVGLRVEAVLELPEEELGPSTASAVPRGPVITPLASPTATARAGKQP